MNNNDELKAAAEELNVKSLDTVTAIITRRSVRKYSGDGIGDQLLHTVLNAGFCAPSAHNRRPWHFIVIRNRDKLIELSEAYMYSKMLKSADCCIAVCADAEVQPTHDFLIADCSAAIENMLLCAHSLGIGGVWIGVVKNTEWYDFIKNSLSLPASIVPAGLISLGVPVRSADARDRFETGKVHYEQFGSQFQDRFA
ncbi:MAG: NADH dehydrogenase [Firmicutes bacterium ADurb.Bin182]|nr:MAG: NADH dehydrogenase [Firmicutes bacterium ADurb.Bin182]